MKLFSIIIIITNYYHKPRDKRQITFMYNCHLNVATLDMFVSNVTNKINRINPLIISSDLFTQRYNNYRFNKYLCIH